MDALTTPSRWARKGLLRLGGDLYDTDDNQFVHDEEATWAVGNAEQVGDFGGPTIELRPGQYARSLVVFALNVGSMPAYVLLYE